MTHKLHDFERKIGRLWIKLERSTVTADNKRLLREFDAHCVTEGLSPARRWKLLEYLYVFSARHFPHPFQGATPGQIRRAVHEIGCTPLAPWTKHDFKVAVRKLFKFIEWGPEALSRPGYPESVASINVRVRKKDHVRIQAADILTEEEAARLTAAASNTRDRAMVSLMTKGACGFMHWRLLCNNEHELPFGSSRNLKESMFTADAGTGSCGMGIFCDEAKQWLGYKALFANVPPGSMWHPIHGRVRDELRIFAATEASGVRTVVVANLAPQPVTLNLLTPGVSSWTTATGYYLDSESPATVPPRSDMILGYQIPSQSVLAFRGQ